MNLGIIKKIINGVFKIFKNASMKKTEMGTGTTAINNGIGASTPIIFTMKSFLSTIGVILGIFYGFYQLVVIPRVENTEQHYETLYNDQKEQNRIFYGKFDEMVKSIGLNTTAIKGTNNRFRDLNTSIDGIANSSGSFNSGSVATDSTDPADSIH